MIKKYLFIAALLTMTVNVNPLLADDCKPGSKNDASMAVYGIPLSEMTDMLGIEPNFKLGYKHGNMDRNSGGTFDRSGTAVDVSGDSSRGKEKSRVRLLQKNVKFKKSVLHLCS